MIAGCFNTALDFLILNVLTLAFGLPVLAANTVSVLLGIAVSYVLNHFFVFRYPHRISLKKFAQFFLVTGFSSLLIQNLIIWAFEKLFETSFGNSLLLVPDADGRQIIAINVAKFCAVLVGLVWNFTMYRFVIFRDPKTPAASENPLP